MTLTEFLLARITADEAAASGPPNTTIIGNGGWYYDQTLQRWAIEPHTCDEYATPLLQIDPARVLAECEAKRRIVERHETIRAAYPGTTIETDPCCAECSAYGEYPGDFPCFTLRTLATIYADHPDYPSQAEWLTG